MVPRILLINPPIYDFAAYDFWLKPYGLLSIAGYLRGKAEFTLFDYLDRLRPFIVKQKGLESDQWGRGRFHCEKVPNPACLKEIPRYFRRFGLPRDIFRDFLAQQRKFDFVLIQTTMTYWYQGVAEVIEDVRKALPNAKIVLGGNYVTLCDSHAQKLGADFLLQGTNLEPLFKFLGITPDINQPALWEAYKELKVGVLKLSEGCPFSCTYCSVPKVYGKFKARPLERSLSELELLAECGAKNIAFYDDALLFDADKVLIPFLNEVIKRGIKVNFHCPNGLHARFVTKELAELMERAGFKTFYLGFESASSIWQKRTGSKIFCDELARAVKYLTSAGAEPQNITAYQILGHPPAVAEPARRRGARYGGRRTAMAGVEQHGDIQELEESMRFVNGLGIRGMLADFSPIPSTPDGELCRKWVDMDEPLFHNKTAFPIILMGFDETNRLKDLQRKLNRDLLSTKRPS